MSGLPASVSDPDAAIDAALAALDHSVLEAKVHDDKIGLYLAATASGIRAQKAISEGLKSTVSGFVNDIARVSQPQEVTLTDKQVDELGRRLASSCGAWAGNLVKAANVRSAAVGIAALAGMLVVGFAAGFYWRGAPPATACQAHDGGIACSYWLQPPTK